MPWSKSQEQEIKGDPDSRGGDLLVEFYSEVRKALQIRSSFVLWAVLFISTWGMQVRSTRITYLFAIQYRTFSQYSTVDEFEK